MLPPNTRCIILGCNSRIDLKNISGKKNILLAGLKNARASGGPSHFRA